MKIFPNPDAIDCLDATANIVADYVSKNAVRPSELCALITSVHQTLRSFGGLVEFDTDSETKPTAAQIRKSVTPDGIVSFLDGKTYKTMKRHVRAHGLDLHAYRERFGLPENYPMVAAVYAAKRSALAKTIGLGRVTDRNRMPNSEAKGR